MPVSVLEKKAESITMMIKVMISVSVVMASKGNDSYTSTDNKFKDGTGTKVSEKQQSKSHQSKTHCGLGPPAITDPAEQKCPP